MYIDFHSNAKINVVYIRYIYIGNSSSLSKRLNAKFCFSPLTFGPFLTRSISTLRQIANISLALAIFRVKFAESLKIFPERF